MAYCSQCGKGVGEADRFCATCGARQPVEASPLPRPSAGPFDQLTPRTASMICYIPFIGWIGSLIVLSLDKFRDHREVRFHAFQGLYLFILWLIVDQVLGPVFRLASSEHFRVDKLLQVGLIVAWVLMIIKTSRSEFVSLPIIGDLAEKSTAGH